MPVSPKKTIPIGLWLLMVVAFAAPPSWWSTGNPPVVDPTAAVNNNGPANIGQAKYMAKSAIDALRTIHPTVAEQIETDLTAGPNPIVDFTVPDPKNPEWIAEQNAPLLIGQLKAIAAPFYTRLHAVAPNWLETERITNGTNHPGSNFPWTSETTDDNNKALANIGQLKAVFSLRFENLPPFPGLEFVLFSEYFESPDVSTTSALQYGATIDLGALPDNGNWVGSSQGYGAERKGLVNKSFGDYTAPSGNNQGYFFGYTNTGITTSSAAIAATLELDRQYILRFDVARDNDRTSSTYTMELVAFAPGENDGSRNDVRGATKPGVVLASTSGTVESNDLSKHVTLVFNPDVFNHSAHVGKSLGIRFIGNSSAPILDNVVLSTIDLDVDDDGIPDTWELANFGDLTRDQTTDSDGDGLLDYQEYLTGFDPNNSDSDGDGNPDGYIPPFDETLVFSERFESPWVTTTSALQDGATHDRGQLPDNGNWILATQGFGANRSGLVHKSFGDFTAPPGNNQAYYFGYTNSGLTTSESAISNTLSLGLTYNLSFDVARDNNKSSSTYRMELVAFDSWEGDSVRNEVRDNIRPGHVLAYASGTVTTNDLSKRVTITFEPDEQLHAAHLGKSIGIRFIGNSSHPIIDNVELGIVGLPFSDLYNPNGAVVRINTLEIWDPGSGNDDVWQVLLNGVPILQNHPVLGTTAQPEGIEDPIYLHPGDEAKFEVRFVDTVGSNNGASFNLNFSGELLAPYSAYAVNNFVGVTKAPNTSTFGSFVTSLQNNLNASVSNPAGGGYWKFTINVFNADADADGLNHSAELALGTDPFNPDSDGDGMIDGWEVAHGLDPLNGSGDNGANGDSDNDGLTNLEEYESWTPPPFWTAPDENGNSTSGPLTVENSQLLWISYGNSLDPNDPDTDNDGMADGWEVYWALRDPDPHDDKWIDPLVPGEQLLDYDGDGLTNLDEFAYGGNPHLSNSDQEIMPEWDNVIALEIGVPSVPVPVPGNGQEVFNRSTGYPYMDPNTEDDSLPLRYLPYRAPAGAYDYNGDGVLDINDVPPAVVFAPNGLPVPDSALNPGFYYFDTETAAPYLNTFYPEEYFDVETLSILPYQYPAYSARGSDENDDPRVMVEDVILRQGDANLLDGNGAPIELTRLKFVPGFGEFVPDPLSIEYIELDAGMNDSWEARHGLDPSDPQDSLKPSHLRYGINNLGYFLFQNELAIDSDGDLIPDILEQGGGTFHVLPGYQTDPSLSDTDGDGLPDGYEILYKLDPMDPNDALDTKNGTVLSPYQKYQLSLHPEYADSDLDGIPDIWEVLNQSDPSGNIQDTLDPGSLTGGLRVWWNFERASGDLVPDDAPFDETMPHDAKLRGNNIAIIKSGGTDAPQSKYLSFYHGSQPFEAGFMLAADRPLLALGTSDFTLGFWMQWQEDENVGELAASNIYAAERQVFSKEGAYEAIFKPANGIFTLRFQTSSGIVSADFPVMEVYEWHHIAVTYDALTGVMNLYQNGQLSSSLSLASESVLSSDHPLIIGSPRTVPSQLLNMSLDDWRLYDVVLTQTDISMLADTLHPLWDRNKDRSGDGVTELQKFLYGMNPLIQSMDTDGDEIPDHMEINGFQIDEQGNPVVYSPERPSTVFYADPRLWDTDGDGLSDLQESRGREITLSITDANGIMVTHTKKVVTNLLSRDTDGDGVDDRDEFELYSTDPTNWDTDEDGLPDGFEIANGLNPLDARDASFDLDGDGFDNLTEYQDGERKVTVNEESLALSSLDTSGDGLNDLYKSTLGLNLNTSDTSGDGLSDFDALSYGLDPLDSSEGGQMAASGLRTVAEEAADGLNPLDPTHQSVVIAPALPLGKTGFVPHDATAEEKIEEFIDNKRNRMYYPIGSPNPVLIAGSKDMDAFGVLEEMTLKGVRDDGSETTITLGAAAIENSFTSRELGKSLPESALVPAQNITGFIDSLARDEDGYVLFWATLTSTKNLLDEEDDDPNDGDDEVQVSVGTGSGGGGWGSGGGYGGGGGWGYFYGGSGIATPTPQTKPTPPEEAEETFKAKANSRIVVFNEAATIQLAVTTPSGVTVTGSRLLNPLNSIIPLNDDFDEGLTDPQTGEPLLDNSNDVALPSDPDLAELEITIYTSTPGEGTFTLSVPGAVNIFDSNGQPIQTADLTVDLSNPTGALAGVGAGSSVTLYFEGATSDADAVFTADLGGAGVNAISREAHLTLLPVGLAVDANRNGEVEFGIDKTSSATPYRFWINNDDDSLEDEEEYGEDSQPDHLDEHLTTQRDLEDFTRLQLMVGGLYEQLKNGDIQVTLKFKDGTVEGNPALNLRLHLGDEGFEGGREYLKDEFEASRQRFSYAFVGKVTKNSGCALPQWLWSGEESTEVLGYYAPISSTHPYRYLLFEGASEGKGELVLEFKKDSEVLGEISSCWINLLDVRKMYQRAKITPDHPDDFTEPSNFEGEPFNPTITPPLPEIGWTWDPNGKPFIEDPEENKEYLIFVHGWRMTYVGSQKYAETMFKRLWHTGYKGRFAFVRWPTYSEDDDSWVLGWTDGKFTYNGSDYRAWLSGKGVAAFVNSLPIEYVRNITAHSMGNIVVGSALREGMLVDNYALFNAAVPAMCYDGNEALYEFPRETPDGDADPITNALGFKEKITAVNVRRSVINFYLEDDSALTGLIEIPGLGQMFGWEDNNKNFKPETFDLGESGYLYDQSRLAGTKVQLTFAKLGLVKFDRHLRSFHESAAYATASRTKTVGADARTDGLINDKVDMGAEYGFGDTHSAEWLWRIQKTERFYYDLMLKLELNPIP